jgi:hypothetical protein
VIHLKIKHGGIIIITILFTLLAIVAGITIPFFFQPNGTDGYSIRKELKETAKELESGNANEPVVKMSDVSESESPNKALDAEEQSKISATADKPGDAIKLESASITEPANTAKIPKVDAQSFGGQEEKPERVDKPMDNNTGKDAVEINKTAEDEKADDEKDKKTKGASQMEMYSQEWIELKIRENGHLIKDQDLQDFRSIIGKLDVEHMRSLMKESNSEKMYENINNYLKSKLSMEEIERAKELFALYSKIVFQ